MFGGPKVSTDEKKIEEILTRGVDNVVERESLRKKLLSGRRLRVKLGIDPTSPNIHIGRAVVLLKLRDFQELGHKVTFIVGDATGVIGDTSDKDSERPMLSRDEVTENARQYFKQAAVLLGHDFDKKYNSEWLDNLSFSKLGELANQFSLADFIARDNIRRRLDTGKRVSLRETLYPLMQGYDSVHIQADVELGGTDQWFNLLAGRPLQEYFGQEPQDIITHTLIPGLDGRKMSSSWGNTINIIDEPTDMYGKVMSLDDELTKTYFESCTRVPMNEVKGVLEGHPKNAKMRLAREIVKLYHGERAASEAEQHFESTFSRGEIPEDAQTMHIKKGSRLGDTLIEGEVVPSKSEFRRLIQGGAISQLETGEKIDDLEYIVTSSGTFKVGKRRFVRLDIK